MKQFAAALAELYIMRRNKWFEAIDRSQLPAKRIAAARLDQLDEVIETLPENIKSLVKQEIDRMK